ncbi:MAG: DUF305 domain-containing protein [Alphaproteobacteria bacterium]|nr:DUF305 domain-containing protein [Alphaproteobacteria bacterium]
MNKTFVIFVIGLTLGLVVMFVYTTFFTPIKHGSSAISILESKNGVDFDRAFLEHMIPHHEEAVATSTMLLQKTLDPKLKKFGQAIIDTQKKEIDVMRTWLNEYSKTSTHSSGH